MKIIMNMNNYVILKSFLHDRYLSRTLTTKEKLKKHQQKKLKQFLNWLCAHSPFYKQYQGRPLAALPIMNKKLMMENFSELNTINAHRDDLLTFARNCQQQLNYNQNYNGITVGLSSGTSGNTGLFIATKQERSMWAGVMLSKALKDIMLHRHRVAFCFRNNSTLYQSLRSVLIDFTFINLSDNIETIAETLKKYQPTILVAPAQVLKLLSETLPKKAINPIRIFSVAEVLEPDIEKKLHRFFNQKIYQIYQCTEGFLGISSPHNPGITLNEEYIFIEKEWINEQHFIPIITDFTRLSQPIVRYRLDDILVMDQTNNNPFTRLKSIEGRCDDILYLLQDQTNKPQAIFPDELRKLFMLIPDIQDYTIEQESFTQLIIALDPLENTQQTQQTIIIELLQKFCKQQHVIMPTLMFQELKTPSLLQKRRRIKRTFTSME